jgi:hypothetical protein
MTNLDYYSHYTTIDKLNLILKSKTIRFTRLDLVDDISETKNLELENISKLVYVSCWSMEKDKEKVEDTLPLWSMYANNMHGVKIILPFFPFIIIMDNKEYYFNDVPNKKECKLRGFEKIKIGEFQLEPMDFSLNESEFCNYFTEIKYDNNFFDKNTKVIHVFNKGNDELAYSTPVEVGRKKHEDWNFQKEFRYFLLYKENNILINELNGIGKNVLCNEINKLNTMEFIDIPIHEKALKEMKIIIGPKCNESEIDFVKYIVEKYNSNIKIDYSKWGNMIH